MSILELVPEKLSPDMEASLKERVSKLKPMTDRQAIEHIRMIANHSANALGNSYHAICEIRAVIKKHYGWPE